MPLIVCPVIGLSVALFVVLLNTQRLLCDKPPVGNHFCIIVLSGLFVGGLVELALAIHACPLLNDGGRFLFIGWCITLCFPFLGRLHRLALLSGFSIPLLMLSLIVALYFLPPFSALSIISTSPHNNMVLIHTGIMLGSFSTLTLAALAAVLFCWQLKLLKQHQDVAILRILPPSHTLECCMRMLLPCTFILFSCGTVFGWLIHSPDTWLFGIITVLVILAYIILLRRITNQGLPGKMLALFCLVLWGLTVGMFLLHL